ncbi:MAG TPA: nitroreductase family protein [Dehalococcoidia bacterium]|nr:nitroreductase family protein [Dehalococcoidia bacterium]
MSEQSNSFVRFLRSLRAVREYTPEPIPEDVIRDIVEVGRWAGSSSNSQPTEVVVVRDKAALQLMAENGARPAAGAAVALLVLTPGDDDRKDIEAFDNGRLVERLLLAAKAHGLGANIATIKGEGPKIVGQALGIPAARRVWTVVTIGHIDQEARKARPKSPTAGRKASESFVHWEKY